jgi:hypothetical protein
MARIIYSFVIHRDQATTVQESIIKLYSHKRRFNGTVDVAELNEECNELHGVHSDLISYITSDSKVCCCKFFISYM